MTERARYSMSASIDPSLRDVLRGVFKIEGELRCLGDRLEYRYRKSGFRRGTDIETWSMGFDDIRELRHRNLGYESQIVVAPRRLGVLEGLPGDIETTIKFKVPKSDRAAARDLAAFVRGELDERDEYEIAGVPFRIPELDSGLNEVRGVMHLEPGFVVLDIESGLSGLTSMDRYVVKVASESVEEMRLKRGVVYDRVTLRVADDAQYEDLPWPVAGKLVLRIGRRHRSETDSIVRVVEMRRDLPTI